jgi:hypothetical protein
MSSATVTQFLVDITRGHQRAAFATNRELVLASSKLDECMRAAVREEDIGTLWSAGAHPMALLYFSRACGWSSEDYYNCISRVQTPPPHTF